MHVHGKRCPQKSCAEEKSGNETAAGWSDPFHEAAQEACGHAKK